MNRPLLSLLLAALPSAALAGMLSSQEPESAPELSKRERAIAGSLSPLPPLPKQLSNRFADDPAAARLGQRLFFDARLSRDGDLSCASCHSPGLGWADGKATAQGIDSLNVHSPSLLLAGHQRWLFWDGRADSLWAQVQWPLEHPAEMGFARADLVRLIAGDPVLAGEYRSLFGALPDGADDENRFRPGGKPALPRPSSPFDPAPTLEELATEHPEHAAWLAMTPTDRDAANQVLANVGKALEAFQRQLIPGPSAFDRWVEGLESEDAEKLNALSPSAVRGFQLFVGKAQCINCHFSPLFSNLEFSNIGLAVAEGEAFTQGRPDGIRTLRVDPFNGRGKFSDAREWASNVKLRYLNYDEHTYGAFKVPSLRNAAQTPPYMHDGRFATLEEVVRFYSELPGAPPVGHREETLVPADLTETEIQDLVAFLESLAGEPVADSLRRPLPRQDD